MKKYFALFVGVMMCLSAAMAQGGQRLSVEERTKAAMEKVADLRLNDDVSVKTQKVFLDYYTNQQKAMEEMREAGSFDGEAMRKKRQEFGDQRDARLKALLTAEQFKKWSEEIEPSMRPQRRSNK